MVKIALLPDDTKIRACYLNGRLPERYMEDFSLTGIVVDRFEEACVLLADRGYQLREEEGGLEISLGTSQQLPALMSILTAHQIHCEISDIADTIYQA